MGVLPLPHKLRELSFLSDIDFLMLSLSISDISIIYIRKTKIKPKISNEIIKQWVQYKNQLSIQLLFIQGLHISTLHKKDET